MKLQLQKALLQSAASSLSSSFQMIILTVISDEFDHNVQDSANKASTKCDKLITKKVKLNHVINGQNQFKSVPPHPHQLLKIIFLIVLRLQIKQLKMQMIKVKLIALSS